MTDEPEEDSSTYLDSFTSLLHLSLSSPLLTPSDLPIISTFLASPPEPQSLYLRLYLRKRRWLRPDTLSYKEVSDCTSAVTELVKYGLLQSLSKENCTDDVNALLKLLSLPQIKALCKQLNQKQGSKVSMMSSLLKMCKSQKTLFGGPSTKDLVKRKCLAELDGLVRVHEGKAVVFDKVLIASFPQCMFNNEEDVQTAQSGRNQLSQIMLKDFGMTKFPSYNISFSEPIFKSRLQFELFLSACQLESKCWGELDNKNWHGVVEIMNDILPKYTLNVSCYSSPLCQVDNMYLEQFTEDWVLSRVLRLGLTALQRLKDYKGAVKVLKLLLQYRPMVHRRGDWWETLALIYNFHLKDNEQAAEVARIALDDEYLSHGYRLAIQTRLEKLDEDYKGPDKFNISEITIEVPSLPNAGMAAQSRNFYLGSEGGETVLCTVENVVINYYINNNGFTQGLHAEGGIVSTLFGVLCWDVVFSEVDNVFYNEFQTYPLDYWSRELYLRRKKLFDVLFERIGKASGAELLEMIEESWAEHGAVGCVGVKWDCFTSPAHMHTCVVAMGAECLVGLFKEYLSDTRLKRSGVPDLSLWNDEEFRMVEVKGPNDVLSNNQRVWLAALDRIGIKAEVCHVKGVSSKRL